VTIIDQIAAPENLELAFAQCLRGKRNALGAQKVFQRLDVEILRLRDHLLAGAAYPWGPYRAFFVSDPKRRQVHSAPFIDRVAHRAIHNVIEPILDQDLLPCVFACRHRRGNGRAVAKLMQILAREPEIYVVKLDVKKYFQAICHRRLMAKLRRILPDPSAEGLIRSLLRSHPQYAHGSGLPLGNLTSQIFANFYLSEIDHFISGHLGDRYLRYMDDLVLVARDRAEARALVAEVVRRGREETLRFPARKRIWLGEARQVPFLGFLVTPRDAVPLNRNRRRFERKRRRHEKARLWPSSIERRRLSYDEWEAFPLRWAARCAMESASHSS